MHDAPHAEFLTAIGDAYLWLIHPDVNNPECRQELDIILSAESHVDSMTVQKLLTGESWRERIVGNVLAVRKGPQLFAFAMLESLANPRGLAIVPTCAALVLALHNQNRDEWLPTITAVDRLPFSGDVGWSLDKALFHLGWSEHDPGGCSPNDGADFSVHLALLQWVKDN